MFILDRYTASIDFLFALRTIYIFFSFLILPKTGPLAILDNDQLPEKPAHGFSGGKLDEQIMTKIEEALVWLGQCKTQAGKALVKEFKGSTAVFMKENLKSKATELLSMQSKMEGFKIFGAADFQEVKTQLASVGKCLLVLAN